MMQVVKMKPTRNRNQVTGSLKGRNSGQAQSLGQAAEAAEAATGKFPAWWDALVPGACPGRCETLRVSYSNPGPGAKGQCLEQAQC